MINKTVAQFAFIVLTMGWFPFMFLSIWGSNQSADIRFTITFLGLFMCSLSSLVLSQVFGNSKIFQSLEELEIERNKLYEVRKRLEKKIMEL